MSQPTANIIGLGLIGGSIALSLRAAGWHVVGDDIAADTESAAQSRELVDDLGLAGDAEITFVAVPVGAVSDQVERALALTTGIVTDVGSVKRPIVEHTSDPRFVGGHPMAGSELDGLEAADDSMFNGAVWVLTPHERTDDQTLSAVSQIVRSMGAEPVAVPADQHDRLVAVVSHVPHLTAATLMGLATDRANEHAALLRLAAGGFRDMTRIASGNPAIWIDICSENRLAIVEALDALVGKLSQMRDQIEANDRSALETTLREAREARLNLPGRIARPERLAEFRIPIPDRSGAAAEVFTLAAELGVNIANFEVTHSVEGVDRGVAVVLVDADAAERFRGGLLARSFRPSITPLA